MGGPRRRGDLPPGPWLAVGLGLLASAAGIGTPAAAAQEPGKDASLLPVPFVPQPPALCGAAAAAMIQRYWDGGRHYADGFAHLLEADGSGIATDVLRRALSTRGHGLRDLTNDEPGVQDALEAGVPVVALIREPGGAPYHYVVIVGWTEDGVAVHDPAWGPGRTFDLATWRRVWRRGSTWAWAVGPAPPGPRSVETPGARESPDRAPAALGDQALVASDASLQAGAYAAAESWALEAHRRGAPRERVQERIALSRYLAGDDMGALSAWNELGRPEVDLIEIEGLRTSRYAPFADFTGLKPEATLTAHGLALARRRAASYPGARGSRIGFEIRADGAASVRGAVVEVSPPGLARVLLEAGAFAATRHAEMHGPGPFDRGGRVSVDVDLSPLPSWSAHFRLPVASAAVTGAVGREWMDPVVRPDAGWPRSARTRGTFTMDRWMHPHLHAAVGATAARYGGGDRTLGLTASVGAAGAGDRLTARLWTEGHVGAFRYVRAGVTATATAASESGAWSGRIEAAGATASAGTPLLDRFTLAGPRGGGRQPDGVLGPRSSGEMARVSLGRQSAVIRLDVVHWIGAGGGPIGVAAVGEAARVGARLEHDALESPSSWAAGIGLRLRGSPSSVFRLDLVRTDRSVFRLGAGWQTSPSTWGRP